MEINKVGYHYRHPASFYIRRPNGSGDYLLLLVFSPSWMILEGKRITTKEPYFILYEKDVLQCYGALEEEYVDDWVHFDCDEKDLLLLDNLGIPRNKPVYLPNMYELSSLIHSMTGEFYSVNALHQQNLTLYLQIFVNKLCELFIDGKENSVQYYNLNKVRSTIYSTPYEEYTVDALAVMAQCSRSSFQHKYKETFGVSPISDLIQARVQYGCYLLDTTDHAVSEIADMCGFQSDIHFMRQFKKNVGCTPTQYRNRKSAQ